MEETKMSIAGINGYNYSNYYTGTKRNTAKANGMNSGLLSNVSSTSSNITLHMSGTEDSGNALTAVGLLPIAVAGIDIDRLMDGARTAQLKYEDSNLKYNEIGRAHV